MLRHLHRYLDVLGDWSTYRTVSSIDEVPIRVAQVSYTFLGLGGLLEGQPRLSGLLGLIVAVHTLEQVTGGLVTAGLGLLVRGRPLARYRGILIRQSPLTAKWAGLVNRITAGRVLEAQGYYFVVAGQTWHCISVTFQLADTHRTLTRLQSLSLPQREYLFDRPIAVKGYREPTDGERTVSIQAIVDLVRGEAEAEAVLGFIGRINELESLLPPLKGAKHFLFMANWLLIGPEERDDPGSGYVDYDALARDKPAGGFGQGGAARTTPSPGGSPAGTWPSTGRTAWPTTGLAPRPVPLRSANSPPPLPTKDSPRPIPLKPIRPANSPPPPPPPFPESRPILDRDRANAT
jgi:hypothetical protein